MITPAQAAAFATSAFVRPAAFAALVAPPPAEGTEDVPYRTVVTTDEEEGELAAQRRLDARSPGFATAVDVDPPGARPSDGLPELVARTPGATVRSIGGLGQFGSVSLRGSSPQQVALFLDGVPLTSSAAGLVDLSSLPLDGLTRIEIYRGHVPVEFGSAAMGGAIDLVGAPAWRPGGVTLRGGFGSFGAHEVGATVRGPLGRRGRSAGALAIGQAGARGDFPYFSDGGTTRLADDDRTARRTANGYERLTLHGRIDHRRGDWRLSVQELLDTRVRGVPAPANAQARRTRLATTASRTVATLRRYGVGGPGGRLEWRAGVGLLHQVFADPAGEVGLAANDQRVVGVDVYLSPRLRLPLWKGAYLGLVADGRVEHFDVDERSPTTGTSGDARRSRLAFGAGMQLEQFLLRDRWLLVPVVRVDALDNRFAVPPGTGEQDDAGRDSAALGVAPRLGTRVRVRPGIELRASGGRYFRPPTLTELFGDRGYVTGNEGLRPERGYAVDGGLVLDRPVAGASVYAQLSGFGSWSEDLIQWVNAGMTTRPINVDGARVRGLESSVAVVPEHRWFTVHANYTFMDTRNDGLEPARRGRALPGRPRHELFARATMGHPRGGLPMRLEPRVLYTVDVIAGTYLDLDERRGLPPRVLQGVGLELHVAGRVHLAFEVRNLLDVRTAVITLPQTGSPPRSEAIVDFIGYPLPGRSLWGSLRIDIEGRRR